MPILVDIYDYVSRRGSLSHIPNNRIESRIKQALDATQTPDRIRKLLIRLAEAGLIEIEWGPRKITIQKVSALAFDLDLSRVMAWPPDYRACYIAAVLGRTSGHLLSPRPTVRDVADFLVREIPGLSEAEDGRLLSELTPAVRNHLGVEIPDDPPSPSEDVDPEDEQL